jgi:hypothetical protein
MASATAYKGITIVDATPSGAGGLMLQDDLKILSSRLNAVTRDDAYESLFTADGGGQGLTTDGDYLYFGKNNGDGVDGTIYKLSLTDGTEVANFAGPQHCAGGSYRVDHGTLLYSGTDSSLWEIDQSDGSKVREWDLSSLEDATYTRSGLVAYKAENTVYYMRMTNTYDQVKIWELTLNDGGTFDTVDTWEHTASDLGTAQGLSYKNGYLYYCTSEVASSNWMGWIYQMVMDSDEAAPSLIASWAFHGPVETEGMEWVDDELWFGDANKVIYRCNFQRTANKVVSDGVTVYGYGPTSTEVLQRWEQLRGSKHAGIVVSSQSSCDCWYGFECNGVMTWDIRYDAGTGCLEFRSQTDNTVRMSLHDTNGYNGQLIVGTAVTNQHLHSAASQVFRCNEYVLQLISTDSGNYATNIILTTAPSSGNNKHWLIAHKGPTSSNRLSFAYGTTAAGGDFTGSLTEMFTVGTDGDLRNCIGPYGGGLQTQVASATANCSGATTTIQVNVPAGAKILGVSLNVTTAITGATSWSAAYTGGSTQSIGSGIALAKNTKHTAAYDANADSDVASSEVDIELTAAGSNFTGGAVRASVYYQTIEELANA